tara:strand:+ start:109 stop:774 length:666 start_codon:yes stop_codon:yes gene_type:complete
MIDQKFILLIFNCKKYKNKREFQKKTWLKSLNKEILYYHIIGDSDKCKNKDYIFDNPNNILYINVKDDYLSLPAKVIRAYKVINEIFNYKYIFKTDDDQVLVKSKFFDTLMNVLNIKSNINYGGIIRDVEDHYSPWWIHHPELPRKLLLRKCSYAVGRFYLISNEVVEHLLKHRNEFEKTIIEDHSVGYFWRDKFDRSRCLKLDVENLFIDIDRYLKLINR